MGSLTVLLLWVLAPQQIDGAGADARLDPTAGEVVFTGRVLDAEDGRPVPGAVVELWTEDNERPALRTHREGVRFDGSFVLRSAPGEASGEKWVVHAPGYGSAADALVDFEEVRLLRGGMPFELRFLDVEGRAVPDVRVRTSRSCAHDAPAARGRSGADGRVLLEAPPRLGTFELFVECEGYGSRKLTLPRGLSDVFLLRLPPVPLRFLDAAGAPVPERRMLQSGWPQLVRDRTDAMGRTLLTTYYAQGRELVLFLCRDGEREWWGGGWPPDEGEWVLRREGEAYQPEPAAAAQLVLGTGDADVDRMLVRAYHEDGWWYLGPGEHAVPAGRLRLVAGAPFTGWGTDARELTLAVGERAAVELAPVREPTLELVLPSAGWWTVHVQAPATGALHEVGETATVSVPVPADVPLTVVAESADGELRRARIDPLGADARVDLGAPATLVRARADTARAQVAVTVNDDRGRPLAARCELVPRAPGPQPEAEHPTPERALFDVTAETTFELEVSAPGYVGRWLRGVAPAEPEPPLELHVVLERRASLVLEGPLVEVDVGGVVRTRAEPGDVRVDALAPGPLRVEALDGAGRRHTWTVELAPGETRHLRTP